MILELKFGSKWNVIELDERVEQVECIGGGLISVRQLVGQVLSGPITKKTGCRFYASGETVDATLIVQDSQGSVVSDGEYIWRVAS